MAEDPCVRTVAWLVILGLSESVRFVSGWLVA
jgi:hypothetical protein